MTPTPKFGKTPLELLEPNTDYDPTFYDKYGYSIVGPLLGVGMSMAINFTSRRPILGAGIPRHALFGVGTFIAFRLYAQYNEGHNAERDAVYRHYIQLHPDDFPPPDRIQFKDMFDKWVPIR